MRTLFVYLLTAVIVGVALFFGYPELFIDEEAAASADRVQGETPVIAARVGKAPFVETLDALGTVLANESLELTANRSDHVAEVHFEDGQLVEEGDLLIQLRVEAEQAQLEEAKARLRQSRVNAERINDLFERGISAESDRDAAEAELQALESRVQSLTATISDHQVRAPFAGVLGLRGVSLGAFVNNQTVLTTLDDLSSVKIDFTIPGIRLSEVAVGQAVVARADAIPGVEFFGEITAIDTRLDANSRSALIRAKVPNKELLLRPGMLARVEVQRGEQPTLQVPEEAVVPIGDQRFVWLVDENQTVNRIEVLGGRRKVGAVEILGGLEEGQLVVIQGLARLVDGGTVLVVREEGVDT